MKTTQAQLDASDIMNQAMTWGANYFPSFVQFKAFADELAAHDDQEYLLSLGYSRIADVHCVAWKSVELPKSGYLSRK